MVVLAVVANPFPQSRPLLWTLLAVLAWLLPHLLARGLPAGSLARAMLLRARLSLSLPLLLGSLAWWLARSLAPPSWTLPDVLELGNTILVVAVVWTLLRWKGELLRKADVSSAQLVPGLSRRDRLALFDVVDKLITGLVLLIIGLKVMQLLGVSAGVLLTAGGFGAAALGFGARTIVENALSGLGLYVNRPFVVGDMIRIPTQNLQGEVENIGWFYTRLRDPERQNVYVPNGTFTNLPVLNVAQTDSRRLWLEFSLQEGDRPAIEPIIADLQAAMAQDPGVAHDRRAVVHFIGYGEAGLNLRLLCYAATGDAFDALALQQRLLMRIGEVVEKHDARMAHQSRSRASG